MRTKGIRCRTEKKAEKILTFRYGTGTKGGKLGSTECESRGVGGKVVR